VTGAWVRAVDIQQATTGNNSSSQATSKPGMPGMADATSMPGMPGMSTATSAVYLGKIVLLYFGYTYCPDVCPLTLGKLAQTVQGLGASAQNIQVIFISVDPERDTLQKLGQYARGFDPGFIGVTGTPQAIASVAHNYGIFYQKTDIQSPTNYLITHTSVVSVIDRQGRWRLLWPEELEPPAMMHRVTPGMKG
jgi:protein SCO1/2